jgi:hypothetical protein
MWTNKQVNIVIMGGSAKGEERIFCNTNYFDELTHFYPDCAFKLFFAGPELSEERHNTQVNKNDRLSGFFYRGTTSEFLLNNWDNVARMKDQLPIDSTLFIGFNPGFGSGYSKLLMSWALDLVFLLNLNHRIVFTQANDFSDLRGETKVFEKLFNGKVRFFIEPQPNPMRAMTHYTEDES